jgi:hypothetical protein
MKCIEKKCIVTFQGLDILTVIGAITRSPESFFMKVYNNETMFPEKSKSNIINDILIESFIREFYTYIGNKLQYMDILTDSTLDFIYLSHARENMNSISLSHVNSIYGDIQFINTNESKYKESLDNISRNKHNISIENDDMNLKTTEIYFLCNTSLYTFLELFMYLPIGCVLESTDWKILYSSDQYIIPEEMNKYKSRITSIIAKMHNERLSMSADKTHIDKYNLIPLNIKIQYSVKFKLSDISDILFNWENKIVKDKIYGDNNNFISKEILKIISDMKQYAIAVYKTIM